MALTRTLIDDRIGARKTVWHEQADGSIVVETISNVDELVGENKAMYAGVDERAGWKGDQHMVARIPLAIYYEMVQSGKINDQAYLKRWLNDPDNKVFRVRPGRI